MSRLGYANPLSRFEQELSHTAQTLCAKPPLNTWRPAGSFVLLVCLFCLFVCLLASLLLCFFASLLLCFFVVLLVWCFFYVLCSLDCLHAGLSVFLICWLPHRIEAPPRRRAARCSRPKARCASPRRGGVKGSHKRRTPNRSNGSSWWLPAIR